TLSEISHAFARDDFDQINRIYKRNLEQQIYLGIIIFIPLVLFSNDILKIFGKDYQTGSLVLILLSAGFLINVSVGMSGEIVALSKHYKFDLYSKFFLITISFFLNIIFIPRFGIEGASFATLITLIIYGLLKVYYVFKRMKMLPYKLSNYIFIISGIATYSIVSFLKQFCYENAFLLILLLFTTFLIYDLFLFYVFKHNSTILNKFLRLSKRVYGTN
ncbi:TPA: hypothetical protein DCR49_03845, partial [Candidatus Delongbacteria bacterium]|nr:hypothetical protein [Candidatus Delongbacteria bacterium]